MQTNSVRFDVECISHLALAHYMTYRRMTVRGLAAEVTRQLASQHPRITVSRATIGHLRSGERKYCKPEVARAIEEALAAPPGSLFVAKVSTVFDVSRAS